MMDGVVQELAFPWAEPPEEGAAVEVAEGVLWLRLPLPMVLNHVNVYVLDDGDTWTVVDTGFHTKRSVAIWERLLDGPLRGKPVGRVILTHHHPDHVGMAGWFQARFGAEIWATRTAWLLARMLTLDEQELPTAEALAFYRAAGMAPEVFDKRAKERPWNFADVVHPIPLGFRRMVEGDRIAMGGRNWDVRIGHGHAPAHATFWSRDDDLVLTGDQVLPGISSNLGVYPTEPEADPVGEWMTSCERFLQVAEARHLALPGHKLPFTGVPTRLMQLIDNHRGALSRLEAHLDAPRTAHDCFPPLFKREIGEGEYGLALVEAYAHLNHLHQRGRIGRTRREDGAWLWHRDAPGSGVDP